MEKILHYIWQQKLFVGHEQCTTDGMPIEVIDVGRLNTDAGADFFNAKIKIGDTMWCGNVEIHTCASDWERHEHQHDKAYNNVILHVVSTSDKLVQKQNGETIVQCELKYPKHVEQNYHELCNTQMPLPCSTKIQTIPNIHISAWKNYLLTERLEQRAEAIEKLLQQNQNHWEETFYVTLARSFGFHVNGLAMEMLAKSLPLVYLGKHKYNLFQIEALLFGQSGLLEKSTNEYGTALQKEYSYLQKRFSLKPLDSSIWKMLRLRPDNFPQVRIAEFAALIHQSNRLLSIILEDFEYKKLVKLFQVKTNSYWDTHYTFGEASAEKQKKLGKSSIDNILINTVIPFAFAYAKTLNLEKLQEKALNLLSQIKPERNVIIERWKAEGINIENAYDSQAFLQLNKHYCECRKCLQCRIGHKILQIKPNDK